MGDGFPVRSSFRRFGNRNHPDRRDIDFCSSFLILSLSFPEVALTWRQYPGMQIVSSGSYPGDQPGDRC